MESCKRATSDFFSDMLSSKGYWYSLFDLDDTSFSLSQLFGVSIDELLDVFEIIGFVKKAEKKLLLLRYGVHTTHHTVLQSTPGQMVFGCDMMLNIPFIAIWGAIRRRKQQLIKKNNQIENKNCQLHTCRVRKKVLVHDKTVNKYEEPYKGTYTITNVCTNGNFTIHGGTV